MDVLVDIGNTNFKWALAEADRIGPATAFSHDEVETSLHDAWRKIALPDSIRVANVAGSEKALRIRDICLAIWGKAPLFAVVQAEGYGVTIAYSRPATLGVDRWLGMVAAVGKGIIPALVVDCGTAVTLDALDERGRHRGGLILPGLGLMGETLRTGTRIPGVALDEEYVGLLGTDTNACISAGAIQATAGMVERVHTRLEREHGLMARIVLTGNDAVRIGRQLDFDVVYERDLVIQGLARLKDG